MRNNLENTNMLSMFGDLGLFLCILLQSELVTFRFAYGRTFKPFISMILGLSSVSLSPKTNSMYLLRHHGSLKNPRNNPNHLKTSYDWKLDIGVFDKSGNLCPTHLEMSEDILTF